MFLMVKLDMFVQTFCLFYIVWVHSFGILLTISVFPQSCILRAEYCLSITSLWLNSAEMEEDRVHWQRASALSRRSGCYFLFRDLFKCSVPGATPLSQGCIPCWGFRWPPLPHLAECPALWHALVACSGGLLWWHFLCWHAPPFLLRTQGHVKIPTGNVIFFAFLRMAPMNSLVLQVGKSSWDFSWFFNCPNALGQFKPGGRVRSSDMTLSACHRQCSFYCLGQHTHCVKLVAQGCSPLTVWLLLVNFWQVLTKQF